MKAVVYINGKASYNITLYKKYTVTDIKNIFTENVPDLESIGFFLDNKNELSVFDNDEYNNLDLGKIWNNLVNPRFYIKTFKSSVTKNIQSKNNVEQDIISQNKAFLLTGIKDVDRLILNNMSDVDVFQMCKLNKTYSQRVCDENFFRNRTFQKYPETIPYKDFINIQTWKKHYLNIVKHIDLLQKEFKYPYNISDKSPELLYLSRQIGKGLSLGYNTVYNKDIIIWYAIRQNFFLLKYLIDTGITKKTYIDSIKQAINVDKIEIFKYLLQNSEYEIDLMQLIEQAFHYNKLSIIQYLNTKFSFNQDDLFLLATEHYTNLKIISYFLKNGANVHAGNDQGFINAIRINNSPVVKLLVKSGVDVQTRDNEALIIASETRPHLLKYLVENGANVNARDGEALINSIRSAHLSAVKLLIENGADVNARNGLAIIIAVERGQLAILKLVVENGADMKTFGEEALRVAKLNNKTRIVTYLKSL